MNFSPLRAALAPFSRRKKYLVGVSGGLDSMLLLAVLGAEGFRKVVVCHLNHGLRPADAQEELALVGAAAERFGYPLEYGECEAAAHAADQKLSLEMAARDLRLKFFQACAVSQRCERVFLAHHADDQAETILMNLVRGTGLAGLGGMAAESRLGRLVLLRPFLGFPRSLLAEEAQMAGVPFSNDPSNDSPAHTRNRVRRFVAPAMEKTFGDNWCSGLLRMAEIVRAENQWVESLVPDPGLLLEVSSLREQPLAARRRLASRWLRQRGVPSPGLAEVDRLLELLDPQTGPSKINLPGGCHARRRSGKIFFEAPSVTKM